MSEQFGDSTRATRAFVWVLISGESFWYFKVCWKIFLDILYQINEVPFYSRVAKKVFINLGWIFEIAFFCINDDDFIIFLHYFVNVINYVDYFPSLGGKCYEVQHAYRRVQNSSMSGSVNFDKCLRGTDLQMKKQPLPEHPRHPRTPSSVDWANGIFTSNGTCHFCLTLGEEYKTSFIQHVCVNNPCHCKQQGIVVPLFPSLNSILRNASVTIYLPVQLLRDIWFAYLFIFAAMISSLKGMHTHTYTHTDPRVKFLDQRLGVYPALVDTVQQFPQVIILIFTFTNRIWEFLVDSH